MRPHNPTAAVGSDLQKEIAMARDSDEAGLKIWRKMLGDAWVDRSLANCNDFNAEIQQQITRQAWGLDSAGHRSKDAAPRNSNARVR